MEFEVILCRFGLFCRINLDSAIECLTFAMNALGFAACPGQFHDITDAKALKKIYLINIWDELPSKENSPINEAYESIFPDLQKILAV